jgi:hypothetical protein
MHSAAGMSISKGAGHGQPQHLVERTSAADLEGTEKPPRLSPSHTQRFSSSP